jgi:hypothetical protein
MNATQTAPRKAEETFYDILKIDQRATISEIVAAYHSAKNAFSKDSVATYSLFSPEETQTILDRLEEAYLTLSNVDKKREYDRQLKLRIESAEVAGVIPDIPEMPNGAAPLYPAAVPDPLPHDPDDDAVNAMPATASEPAAPALAVAATDAATAKASPTASSPPVLEGPVTGTRLREIREKRTLSLDDVSRITKIPTKFLRAIEEDDLKRMPARVYLQGFVKNLATLYRLNPKDTVKSYLEHIDALGPLPNG